MSSSVRHRLYRGACSVVLAAATAATVALTGQPDTALAASPVVSHTPRPAFMRRADSPPPTRTATSSATTTQPGPLTYQGSTSDFGVTIGRPQVYLVFWGSQWGAASTDASGNVVLSGDPDQAAPYLQRFFKGLGTGGETWSGVMTQYCQGVPQGATSCYGPPSLVVQHVGYPTGGALAGVWVDSSTAAPAQATPGQIGTEAVAAAQHFGLTTPAANRSVQYDILSPPGTHPDGFPTGFCAWHSAAISPYGELPYTNMPYVADYPGACGANSVNGGPTGILDGFSIVNGHEYAETITDQVPFNGWINNFLQEAGDPCAWLGSGGGRIQNITLTTGTFAVQGIWSNSAWGCEISHSIVS